MKPRFLRAAASLALFVLPATATASSLVGSRHDFSYIGGEPCAYCHSVHHAAGGVGRPAYMGPLPDITAVYNSSTLDHQLTTVAANQSDAPLCLTCHDGAFVSDNMSDTNPGKAEILAKLAANRLLNVGDDNLDLSNDHPVGFVYNLTLDDDIKLPTNPRVNVTFGLDRNEMWCSTCHNVHNDQYRPFLAMSNSSSALCFECHIK